MIDLTVTKGTSRDFLLQAKNPDGSDAQNVFLNTDPITSRVWQGEDQNILITLATTWFNPANGLVDASAGIFKISVNDADTSSLEVGQYHIQTTSTRFGRTAVVMDAFFSVTVAPGTSTLRPTYASFQEMVRAAPWIQNLQTENDLEGFATERANAREWLDNLIVHNYRGASIGRFETHSMAAFMFGFSGQRRALILSQWLKDLLAGNMTLSGGVYQGPPGGALLITAHTKRIVTYRAIAEIAMGMLGKGGDYAAWGVQFRHAANAECLAYTAELDTNNDGRAEIAIPLATSTVLYT